MEGSSFKSICKGTLVNVIQLYILKQNTELSQKKIIFHHISGNGFPFDAFLHNEKNRNTLCKTRSQKRTIDKFVLKMKIRKSNVGQR